MNIKGSCELEIISDVKRGQILEAKAEDKSSRPRSKDSFVF